MRHARIRNGKTHARLGLSIFLTIAGLMLGAASGVAKDTKFEDPEISAALEEQLVVAKGVSANAIDIAVESGVVTLSGSVDNLLAKERAVRIARMIKGVGGVINTIQVEPEPRTDDEIRRDVIEALATDPATDSWEIDVKVEDAAVTLSGTVDSWHEKQLAATVAKAVKGVREVSNEIAFEVEEERLDSEIEAEIERALMWDARIEDALIDVTVEDGHVSLSGAVGSDYEKTLALGKAWVAGVESVEAEELAIQWWARNEMIRRDRLSEQDGEDTHEAIKTALLYDPRAPASEIEVQVDDGTAVLRGKVDNLKSARAAADTTSDIAGVWRVKNFIKVRPREPRSDEAVASGIKNALLKDPYLERREISVSVDNGVVRLTGAVDSYFEKWQAEDLAARVNGVARVENRLTVGYEAPEAPEAQQVLHDWDVIDSDRDLDGRAFKSDWEIRQDIEEQLFWSPFVDDLEVDVKVEDGVAILTGTVETWSERQAAAENAIEGGAVHVVNQLDVLYGPQELRPGDGRPSASPQ